MSTWCSCRGPRTWFSHPHGGSQHSATPVWGSEPLFWPLRALGMHMVYRYTFIFFPFEIVSLCVVLDILKLTMYVEQASLKPAQICLSLPPIEVCGTTSGHLLEFNRWNIVVTKTLLAYFSKTVILWVDIHRIEILRRTWSLLYLPIYAIIIWQICWLLALKTRLFP